MVAHMTDQEIFNSFRLYFPDLADNTQKWEVCDEMMIICYLNDGRTLTYDNLVHGIRWEDNRDYDPTEENWRNEFADNLNRQMLRRGITQRELAVMTGISQSAISHYANASKIPGAYNVLLIADALSCTVDDLMRVKRYI